MRQLHLQVVHGLRGIGLGLGLGLGSGLGLGLGVVQGLRGIRGETLVEQEVTVVPAVLHPVPVAALRVRPAPAAVLVLATENVA